MSVYRPGVAVWVATQEDEEAAALFLSRVSGRDWRAVDARSESPGELCEAPVAIRRDEAAEDA